MINKLLIAHRSSRSRNGFNLIEAAIVLGVVGLVVGGIWVAAATVAMNNTVQSVAAGALQYKQAAQIMAKTSGDFSWLVSGSNSAQFRIDTGMLPASWVATDFTMFAPNGLYNLTTDGIRVGAIGRDSVTRTLRYAGLAFIFKPGQGALCRRLVVALTHDYQKINMVVGYVSNSAVYPFGGNSSTANTVLTAPLSPSDTNVSTICNATNSSFGNAPVFGIGWSP